MKDGDREQGTEVPGDFSRRTVTVGKRLCSIIMVAIVWLSRAN